MPLPSIRKQAIIATLAISGSRITGLAREIAFAFFFGASASLDCFIAAFRIPNLLRDLFSEGALSNAFITTFSKKMAREGDPAAWELANRIFSFITVVVGSLTVLGIIFSPALVHLIASGFTGDKFQFAVSLNRLLFPFILFLSMAAISMGMLNARGKFALPQSASTFFNITSILCGIGFAFVLSPETILFPIKTLQGMTLAPPDWIETTKALTGMAIGTLLGGLVQWLVQMPALFKMGFRLKLLSFFKDKGVREVLRLTGPAIIGGAAVQVNVLVNTNFASFLEDGSMAWLNYAFRLMQFPIGVFGVAVATATTPALARLVAGSDGENFKKTLRESTGLALFLCIPSALGLILFAKPILALIYEYGRFSSFDTLQSAHALMAYAVGLVFYALIKIYQPAFLAHNDAKTPMLISLASMAINALLNWFLVFQLHFRHWGLALGTSAVALWNAGMLLFLLDKKIHGIWNRVLLIQILKILFASTLAVLAGWASYHGMLHLTGEEGFWQKILLVSLPIGMTLLFYYLFCSWLRVEEVNAASQWVIKKISSLQTHTK